ncbi:hypothetical protein DM01DRAFT_1407239 [Hesseltinella vesiculosa]|uniref:Uncharacterized protein n=1 Tax=Hesseltinella vesiculosa TaxID=101127 RepID=A0A1X2GHY8_9FUNG|nr:hypothetical protein DM01DRAFT_1407239 [Hesseltinella vesiculosa]
MAKKNDHAEEPNLLDLDDTVTDQSTALDTSHSSSPAHPPSSEDETGSTPLETDFVSFDNSPITPSLPDAAQESNEAADPPAATPTNDTHDQPPLDILDDSLANGLPELDHQESSNDATATDAAETADESNDMVDLHIPEITANDKDARPHVVSPLDTASPLDDEYDDAPEQLEDDVSGQQGMMPDTSPLDIASPVNTALPLADEIDDAPTEHVHDDPSHQRESPDAFGQPQELQDFTDGNNWGDFNDQDFGNDDEFGDFDDFAPAADGDDDDFGDFDEPMTVIETPDDTLASQYVKHLQSNPASVSEFVTQSLEKLWDPLPDILDEPPLDPMPVSDQLLCTPCSRDLWDKLSRDTVFYNPVTGSIGQFQWTRSYTNRAYLKALGVRINQDDRFYDTRTTSMASSPTPASSPVTHQRPLSQTQTSSQDRFVPPTSHHTRSSSLTNGLSLASVANGVVPTKHVQEEEPELDIDIARAYCELTEETIRVFPDVKLNAMVVELTRLQRQAKEYLGYLLDQREQLMMDAETYNDLISCIVGHAQRLREQHAVKDASPAMVSKKKKTGFSSMISRRKNTAPGGSAGGGTSMGGGVVGIQSSTSKSRTPGESRRSM